MMKQTLYVILLMAGLCWQCKEKKEPLPHPGEINNIDVFKFTIPGIDPKDITVGQDLIVVHLPENYALGDYIKPEIVFGSGYSSQSPVLNGFNFEGKEITLRLERTTKNERLFNIIVVPYKAIQLKEPPKNLQLTIGPEASFTASFDLKGTMATVNDSGKLMYEPFVRFTDKATGQILQNLSGDPYFTRSRNELTFTLPATTMPGEYMAEVIWGKQKELLSSQIVIKPGSVQFKRGSWHILEGEKYFEVAGFNFLPTEKYEAIIQNDFTAAERISLKYEKPGTLSGTLPEDIGLGNYKITYLQNGKEREPYIEKQWLDRYSGDDNFYIRKYSNQPVTRIVTQLSHRVTFHNYMGFDDLVFSAATEINRQEPILVYTQSTGAFPNKNELILVDHNSRAEYILTYSGNIYSIFDGFISFLYYPVTADIPNGQYEVYIIRGTEKTERYSQIITLK